MEKSPTIVVQRLFLQHTAPLRGFLFGLMADRAAVDDVLQEVFMTVMQRAAAYDQDRDFFAWARGIARNKVLEYARTRTVAPLLLTDDLLEVVAVAGEEVTDQWAEQRAALAACIAKLAPRARQILEWRYAEEPLGPAQIATRLAWSVSAVNVALSRARKFLQECTRRVLAWEGTL